MFVMNPVSTDARVTKEASTLVRDGHQVIIIGMLERDFPRQETMEGFTILRVTPRPAAALGPAAPPLRMALMLLDFYGRSFWRALTGRFDVYHAHDLVTLPLAWSAARLKGAKVLYDAHELFTEIARLGRFPRVVFAVVERLLIGRADRVITVNDSIAAELARRYRVSPPVVLMNTPRTAGVERSREKSPLRARVGLSPDEPLVLFQGWFQPHRGLENLVRAVRHFRRGHLVFMGWGPLRDALCNLAEHEGVQDRVHFTEGVPLGDLLSYTAGADLGAIPYLKVGLNNYFTSPNKLFEYCASGVPVVSSRFPELVKIVEGFGIGRTFDPEKPEEIAAAVSSLLDVPTALARARENVRKISDRFTWETESHKLVSIYRSLGVSR